MIRDDRKVGAATPRAVGAVVLPSVMLGLVLASGCSGTAFKTAEVTGTVTYKGRPAAGIALEFAPPNGDKLGLPPAYGATDREGRYTLRRKGGGTGAVVGMNRVTLRSSESEGATPVPDAVLQSRVFEVDVKPGPNVHDLKIDR